MADLEMKTSIAAQGRFSFPSEEQLEAEAKTGSDLAAVQARIRENINALQNFKERGDPNHSRLDHMTLLRNVGRRSWEHRLLMDLLLAYFVPGCVPAVNVSSTGSVLLLQLQ